MLRRSPVAVSLKGLSNRKPFDSHILGVGLAPFAALCGCEGLARDQSPLWARRQFSPLSTRRSVAGRQTAAHRPRPGKLKSLPHFTDGWFQSARAKVIAAPAFGGSEPKARIAAQGTSGSEAQQVSLASLSSDSESGPSITSNNST